MNQLLEYVALGWIDYTLAKMPPEQRAVIQALWEKEYGDSAYQPVLAKCDICQRRADVVGLVRPKYSDLYLCEDCLLLVQCDLEKVIELLEAGYPGLTEALKSVIDDQPDLAFGLEVGENVIAEWDVNSDAHILDDITIVENIVDYYKSNPKQWAVIRNQATVRSKQLRPALQLPPQMDDVDLHCISRPLNKHLLELGYVRKYEAHPCGDGRMVELLVKGE